MSTIMFYINQIYDGGAERVMVYLANAFAEAGYTSVLVTSFRHEGEYQVSKKVIRHSIDRRGGQQGRVSKNVYRIRVLRAICKKYHPQVLLSFMPEPNFRAMFATIGLSTKNIISVRNDPTVEYAGKVRHFLAHHFLVHAAGCVFQNKGEMVWFPKRLQEKSTIIMNPVWDGFFDVERKPRKGLVVSCGRLTEPKNFNLLIEAFSEVSKQIPWAKLHIYGRGELEEELKKRIGKLGLEEVVFLKGQTTDVPKALSEAEVFVLSSNFEGMPNALLEAMTVGVPCISTDCPPGGPREVFEDDKNGVLVPVGDKVALAKAICTLLKDEQKRQELSGNAISKAEDFRGKTVFRQWERYVSAITEGRNG